MACTRLIVKRDGHYSHPQNIKDTPCQSETRVVLGEIHTKESQVERHQEVQERQTEQSEVEQGVQRGKTSNGKRRPSRNVVPEGAAKWKKAALVSVTQARSFSARNANHHHRAAELLKTSKRWVKHRILTPGWRGNHKAPRHPSGSGTVC